MIRMFLYRLEHNDLVCKKNYFEYKGRGYESWLTNLFIIVF